MRELFIVPSIRSREVALAQRSAVRHRQDLASMRHNIQHFHCSMKAKSVSYQPVVPHPALVPSGTLDSGTASTGVIPSA
jgi:hypothetical protein